MCLLFFCRFFPPFSFKNLTWTHLKIVNWPSWVFWGVGLFNLNIHTDFYEDCLKKFEDKNDFVENTKWGISGKRSVFLEKTYSGFFFILTPITFPQSLALNLWDTLYNQRPVELSDAQGDALVIYPPINFVSIKVERHIVELRSGVRSSTMWRLHS